MLRIFLIAVFCLFCVGVDSGAHRAVAFWHGAATASCPQGAALPDGCLGAPANGQFQNATYFSTAPSVGQPSYSSRPSWNVACVDYACGNYTATASLPLSSTLSGVTSCSPDLDSIPNSVQCNPLVQNVTGNVSGTAFHITTVNTNLGAIATGQALGFSCTGCNHPLIASGSGSDWVLDRVPTQTGSTVSYSGANIEVGWPISIKHYNFDDAHFYAPCSGIGDCSNTPFEMEDIDFSVGVNLCRQYGGNGMIQANALDVTMKSVRIHYKAGCSPSANLFKTNIDPGLATLSTAAGASISSGVLSFNSTADTWYVGQYIYYGSAQTTGSTLEIVSLSSGLSKCVASACNSLTAVLNSCPFGCNQPTGLNVMATTILGGPIETTISGAVSGAFARSYQYVASEVAGNLDTGAGNGNVSCQFCYVTMSPEVGAHSDGISQQPVGDVHDFDITYSLFAFTQQAYTDVGTGTIALFTQGSNNQPPPSGNSVTRTNVVFDHDNIVSSLTYNASQSTTNPFTKSIQDQTNQGSNITTVGQGNSTVAAYTGSQSATTLHVTNLASGTISVGGINRCADFSCRASKITAQIATAGGDVSTWTLDISQTAVSQSMVDEQYLGQITNYTATNNKFDCAGSNGGIDTGQGGTYFSPSGTLTVSGNTNLQSGAVVTGSCPTN